MLSEDPYQTLSITSPGPATLLQAEKRKFPTRAINDVSDIDGAQSQPKYKLYLNKPQILNSDIPGSTSRHLVHGKNVPDNSLRIDDIDGTRRAIKDRMMRTTRHVNPLEPNYPLPAFSTVEPIIPPFHRDTMDISDIDGTKPIPRKEFAPRDTMYIADIEGSGPGLKHQKMLAQLRPRELLQSQDVCARTHRHVDRTMRVTDPNQPSYVVNGMVIADDHRSRPKELPPYIADSHLLQTKDIAGAVASTRAAPHFARREFRNTNFIGDIEGTNADSIKHSIRSNRMSNPLQPVYQSLDPGEVLLPLVPPLVPAELIKIPTLPPLNREKAVSASLLPDSKPQSVSHGGNTSNTMGDSTFGPNSTWGGATGGGGGNAADLDPVMFTEPPSSKPPSGRLGIGNNHNAAALALPLMPTLPNSGRGHVAVQFSSARKVSPLVSDRNYGQLTPSQLRVQAARMEEINMVRSLQ